MVLVVRYGSLGTSGAVRWVLEVVRVCMVGVLVLYCLVRWFGVLVFGFVVFMSGCCDVWLRSWCGFWLSWCMILLMLLVVMWW